MMASKYMPMDDPGNQLSSFVRVVAFAADKHRTQRRKDADASPYINHPIALASVLASEGGISDLTVLCAAVLHDTIEDTQTTGEELATMFGSKVASVVLEVTAAPPARGAPIQRVAGSCHAAAKLCEVKPALELLMTLPLIVTDPEILGGTPVFAGTRVPVRILFEHLEAGDSLDVFLRDFPTVRRELAVAVLEEARAAVAPDAHPA